MSKPKRNHKTKSSAPPSLRSASSRLEAFLQAEEKVLGCAHDLELMKVQLVSSLVRLTGATGARLNLLNGQDCSYPDVSLQGKSQPDPLRRIGAILSTKICENETVAGTLSIFSRSRRSFTSFDFRTLKLFAHHFSAALSQNKNRIGTQIAQVALLEAKNLFRALLESTTNGVIIHDGKTVLQVNAGLEEMFGYNQGELRGMAFEKLFPKALAFPAYDTELLESRFVNETCGRKKNGDIISIQSVGQGCLFEGRSVRIATIKDITSIKNSERAIQESEKRFKRAFEYAPVGMGITCAKGQFLSANPSLCNMFGYSQDEFIAAKPPSTAIASYSIQPGEVQSLLSGVLNSIQFQRQYSHRSGRLIWADVNVSLVSDEDASNKQILIQYMDITQRKLAETALEESLLAYRTLLYSAPVPIVNIDIIGRVKNWNKEAEHLFGWTEKEVVDGYAPFLSGPYKTESKEIIHRLLTGERITELALTRHRRNGTPVLLSLAGVFVDSEHIDNRTILMIVSDVTKAREFEAALLEAREQAEKMARTKSEFLANMSHEIRTPLNAVLGMSELLQDSPLGPDQFSLAQDIATSAGHLLHIVNDILDFSKIDAGRMTIEVVEFNLDTIIDDSIRTFEPSAKGKSLKLERPHDEVAHKFLVKGDPKRLQQVLHNLIGNALKFTAKGAVEVSKSPFLKNATHWVRIEVKDSGIGLAPSVLPRLFQPFTQADNSTTRKFGGSGLGLSICKSLVSAMGGEIGVRSTEGIGSTFWFELPLAIGSEIQSSLAPDSKTRHLKPISKSEHSKYILLAEDNVINQRVAGAVLTRMGYRYHTVSNGKEAIEALKAQTFDAVLMDCQMPEMDGYAATEMIRSHIGAPYREIPIIALTANAIDGDRERCLAVGMNAYISKPFHLDALAELLIQVCEGPKVKSA